EMNNANIADTAEYIRLVRWSAEANEHRNYRTYSVPFAAGGPNERTPPLKGCGVFVRSGVHPSPPNRIRGDGRLSDDAIACQAPSGDGELTLDEPLNALAAVRSRLPCAIGPAEKGEIEEDTNDLLCQILASSDFDRWLKPLCERVGI